IYDLQDENARAGRNLQALRDENRKAVARGTASGEPASQPVEEDDEPTLVFAPEEGPDALAPEPSPAVGFEEVSTQGVEVPDGEAEDAREQGEQSGEV